MRFISSVRCVRVMVKCPAITPTDIGLSNALFLQGSNMQEIHTAEPTQRAVIRCCFHSPYCQTE